MKLHQVPAPMKIGAFHLTLIGLHVCMCGCVWLPYLDHQHVPSVILYSELALCQIPSGQAVAVRLIENYNTGKQVKFGENLSHPRMFVLERYLSYRGAALRELTVYTANIS